VIEDKYITVDGLNIRYLEAGAGPAVLMLHGGSLGSSADVFLGNISMFAAAGFRAIAFDQPGFGLSDIPDDHSNGYRRAMMPKFTAALGLAKVALFAHSQAGGPAMQLALKDPAAYSHLVVLGTGSLLPPLEQAKEGRDSAVQQRVDRRMAQTEPSIEDTRKLLESTLFHHELITDDALELRHSRSIGKNFDAFVARSHVAGAAPAKASGGQQAWQQVDALQIPSLFMYGREDRANAFERAMLWKQQYPALSLHIVSGCKHLVPWDAADEIRRLVVPFLKDKD
jgi:pimeloyl-ACP methyl ester carboxylesterase